MKKWCAGTQPRNSRNIMRGGIEVMETEGWFADILETRLQDKEKDKKQMKKIFGALCTNPSLKLHNKYNRLRLKTVLSKY